MAASVLQSNLISKQFRDDPESAGFQAATWHAARNRVAIGPYTAMMSTEKSLSPAGTK